jgi:hypothetical protein
MNFVSGVVGIAQVFHWLSDLIFVVKTGRWQPNEARRANRVTPKLSSPAGMDAG